MAYVVCKPFTSKGNDLKRGDILPSDYYPRLKARQMITAGFIRLDYDKSGYFKVIRPYSNRSVGEIFKGDFIANLDLLVKNGFVEYLEGYESDDVSSKYGFKDGCHLHVVQKAVSEKRPEATLPFFTLLPLIKEKLGIKKTSINCVLTDEEADLIYEYLIKAPIEEIKALKGED